MLILATKGSVQQSQVNRPVYSEHVPVTPGPGKPSTGQMTRIGTRCSVSPTTPGKPGAPTTLGSPGRFSSHRSTNQCTLNMYQSHRDPIKPGTGQMTGTGTQSTVTWCSVSLTTPGKPGCTDHTGFTGCTSHTGFTGHSGCIGQTSLHWSKSSKGKGRPVPGPV